MLGALILTAMVSSFGAEHAAAQAKPVPGKLAGVVRDSSQRRNWERTSS